MICVFSLYFGRAFRIVGHGWPTIRQGFGLEIASGWRGPEAGPLYLNHDRWVHAEVAKEKGTSYTMRTDLTQGYANRRRSRTRGQLALDLPSRCMHSMIT
jgi:hypothetical protein